MLLIVRTEKEGNTSKRDLILNLFYSGFYLPLACWVSQNRGSDCLCRTKNFISMLLLVLTHFIILEHLSVKFIETLKSLNSTQSSKGMRAPIIYCPIQPYPHGIRPCHGIRLWFARLRVTLSRSVERHGIVCHVKWTVGRAWSPKFTIFFCKLYSRQQRLWL